MNTQIKWPVQYETQRSYQYIDVGKVPVPTENRRVTLPEYKVMQGDELTHHFVFCTRNSDGTVGLYDLVHDTFHTTWPDALKESAA